MGARARLAALAVLLLGAVGCTDGGPERSPGADPPVPPESPRPFAAAGEAPSGWQTTQCSDLRIKQNSGFAVRYALPPTFSGMTHDRDVCEAGSSIYRSLRVAVAPRETLLTYKEENVDPYVGSDQGDAEHGEVSYTADTRVFGDVRGERLEYFCFCDGQNLAYRVVQADGVRLTWITPHQRPVHARDYRAVTRSVALLRSRESFCTVRGRDRRAAFTPPLARTWLIDNAGDGCHLYFDGRSYAEVVPAPPRTLGEIAGQLRRDRHVTRVGVSSERVTWTATYGKDRFRGVTEARPGLQVTWFATLREWRQEADAADAFVDSARLLPR